MSEETKTKKTADHAEIKQVGRFGLVGILNTVVDFVVYNGLLFFVITAAGLYIIRPMVIYFFTETWLWPSQVLYSITSALQLPFSQEFDTRNLALVAAIAVVLIYNYLLYKYYVFNEKIR